MTGRERLAVFVFSLLALAGLSISYYRSRIAPSPVEILTQTETQSEGIDINTAEWWELVLLPGIGEKTARRIVEFRESEGRFESVQGLLEVPGIGPATVAGVERYVKVVNVPRGTLKESENRHSGP